MTFLLYLSNQSAEQIRNFEKDHFSIYHRKSVNLVTLYDWVTGFSEAKSFTKSRVHCIHINIGAYIVWKVPCIPNVLFFVSIWLNFSFDKTKVLCLMLHSCDVSHPAKRWGLHHRWTARCMEEFFVQGDREKELGLEYSPLCDRHNTMVPQSQIG